MCAIQDGDGVEYDEFCNWLVAEDAKDLGPSGRPSSKMSSKLSSKAPSMSSSRPKPPTPAPVNKLMPKPQTPMKKPLKAHKGGDWVNAVAEDAPMRENDGHVDHSLEMFRTGHAMGGNYKYDGEVAASGRDEHGPVTEKELETAHDLLREKLVSCASCAARLAHISLLLSHSHSLSPYVPYVLAHTSHTLLPLSTLCSHPSCAHRAEHAILHLPPRLP